MPRTRVISELPPPLPETEAPPLIMSNPVLTRRPPRRQAHVGWYVGVPVAVIALGALAYFVSTSMSQPSLINSQSTTTQETSTTQTAAPAPAPAAAPAPMPTPAPAQVAATTPAEQPVMPPTAITPRFTHYVAPHHVVRHATSADDSGTDVSATAPQAIAPPPNAEQSSAPPSELQTITPPPN